VFWSPRGGDQNSRGIGIEATGISPEERGFIAVDAQLRTSQPHIFAVDAWLGTAAARRCR